MGGVRYSDKKRWVDFIPSEFANFLCSAKKFLRRFKTEWILQWEFSGRL
jgi:hypothetical protein